MTGNPFYAKGPVEPQYFANRRELLEFFTENVTDAEKLILLKCAEINNRIFSPSEIMSKSMSKLLERLAKKELLVKMERGKYSLYHPLFKEYLKNLGQI